MGLRQMSQLEIRYVSPDELRPLRRECVTHSKKQVRQIADSITRFAFANPIIVSGDHEVIAGHGRLGMMILCALEQCR